MLLVGSPYIAPKDTVSIVQDEQNLLLCMYPQELAQLGNQCRMQHLQHHVYQSCRSELSDVIVLKFSRLRNSTIGTQDATCKHSACAISMTTPDLSWRVKCPQSSLTLINGLPDFCKGTFNSSDPCTMCFYISDCQGQTKLDEMGNTACTAC